MKKHMFDSVDIQVSPAVRARYVKSWRARLTCGLLFMIILSSSNLFSQPAGFDKVTDVSGFREHFKKVSASVKSIESNFRQEKILSAITERITSTGQFWFKRSNRVKIVYIKPFSYVMVLDGDKMLVRDGQKETQINVRSNKLFQQVNRIMIDCVQGTILESKDFTSKVYENADSYFLELTPTPKALREYFKNINLTVDKADYTASSIEMNEPSGDKTTIFFTNKKLNTPIQDAVFAL